MDNKTLKKIVRYIISSAILTIIFLILALVIAKLTSFDLKDILFVQGIILVLVGVFAATDGNSMGLSMQGLGQQNAQYLANANLEVTKMEKKINKCSVKSALNTISLIVAGALCILINFII